MENITEKDLILDRENFVLITLINDKELGFPVDGETALWLTQFFSGRTDEFFEWAELIFICFPIIYDRQVFIRLSEIRLVIFSWDIKGTVLVEYRDSFEALLDNEEVEGEKIFPDAIFLLKGQKEALVYFDLDADHVFIGIDELSMNNEKFVKHGYICIEDMDGEDNYIAISQIVCCELSRKQVYPDDEWEEIKKAEAEEKVQAKKKK